MVDRIESLTSKIDTLQGRQDALKGNVDRLDRDIKEMQQREYRLGEAMTLLNHAAELSRASIKSTVERVITRTIRGIMEDDNYLVEIVFEKKRNQIEARLTIEPPGGNLLDSKGGTILDIVTTTMRLIIKELLNAGGPIAVDEPAKNIAATHQPNFIRMLKDFAHKTGTQIIMCSHEIEYIREADTAIEVRFVNGSSTATIAS